MTGTQLAAALLLTLGAAPAAGRDFTAQVAMDQDGTDTQLASCPVRSCMFDVMLVLEGRPTTYHASIVFESGYARLSFYPPAGSGSPNLAGWPNPLFSIPTGPNGRGKAALPLRTTPAMPPQDTIFNPVLRTNGPVVGLLGVSVIVPQRSPALPTR